MASLLKSLSGSSNYFDKSYQGTPEEYHAKVSKSSTLYVGNLSFYTSEEQIYELFSQVGEIRRIIMGLDRHKKTPCGFCFIEFYRRADALASLRSLKGTKLDERDISLDIDPGFSDGRQFGRGKSGGQVSDERRRTYDQGRGGFGPMIRGAAYEDVAVPSGGDFRFSDIGTSSYKRRQEEDSHNPRSRRRGRNDL